MCWCGSTAAIPGRYAATRLVLFATTGVALLGYYLYPLAPPRLMNGGDFIDTVLVHHTWGSMASGDLKHMSNQYAAMPSMHIGWSLWCGLTIFALASAPWARVLGLLYPAATLLVIVATANHFWLDAVGGMICLAFGFAVSYAWYGALPYRLPRRVTRPAPDGGARPGRADQRPAAAVRGVTAAGAWHGPRPTGRRGGRPRADRAVAATPSRPVEQLLHHRAGPPRDPPVVVEHVADVARPVAQVPAHGGQFPRRPTGRCRPARPRTSITALRTRVASTQASSRICASSASISPAARAAASASRVRVVRRPGSAQPCRICSSCTVHSTSRQPARARAWCAGSGRRRAAAARTPSAP